MTDATYPITRIAVQGSSGSGKTTFSAELARRLRVPHVELDGLYHGPNWTPPEAEVFCARVRQAMAADPRGWVVDGNYERYLDRLVTDAAETVVWLDVMLHVLLGRILRRTSHRVRDHVELWNGNRETWPGTLLGSEALIPYAIHSFVQHRREWPARFADHPDFVRLRTPEQARRWLDQRTRL